MDAISLPLADSLLLQPRVFEDERGFFTEFYSQARYENAGIRDRFVQDNVSYSRRGVLRGLHGDPRMAKLVGVLRGEVFDVIVDIRAASQSYGKWFGVTLRAGEHRQLYVPHGFLHGFLALSDDVLFLYKQTAPYDPATEFGVAWDDRDLAIEWPLGGLAPILSAKDAANPPLRELRAGLP
jgi:dTDP-4-dehydrorhamnose 3,5-epimerase